MLWGRRSRLVDARTPERAEPSFEHDSARSITRSNSLSPPGCAGQSSGSVRESRHVVTDTCGYDTAKKVRDRKRQNVTDTTGLMVGVAVHPADIQDRDGAPLVVEDIHDLFPWLRHLFADSAYSSLRHRNY